MSNIDIDFFKELCLKHGELRHYKKNEFILHEDDVCSFFGFILSGVVKYSCTNRTENKPYNVGFSFPNEFIGDYPTCLYGMKSELNIQAIIPCEIYICSSAFLQQKFEENKESQRIARITAEQMFFQSYSRYLDLFRFTPEERYLQLLKKCPAILQMVSLKEIASYLKITPVHMSRIRRKQSLDNKK
nr:Crp/Fnr family transcriptional regulator [Bacteroides uniformis]